MLLLLQLISLSSVAFGQFFGAHPMTAGHSGLSLSPYANGESEQLPISEDELAQLMAQSLATSSDKNYGRPPFAQKQNSQNEDSDNEDFESNYEDGDDTPSHPPVPQPPSPPHHQPDEESNNEGGEDHQGGYEQQEGGDEGAPYQQHGNSEGEQGGSDQKDNEGFENAGPSYQQEGEHYQNGQYPPNSYGSQSNEEQQREPQSGAYDDHNQRGSPYDNSQSYGPQSGSYGYQNSPDYRSRGGAVSPRGHQYHNDFSYSGAGAGYSGPGSESLLIYDIRNLPKSMRYRS